MRVIEDEGKPLAAHARRSGTPLGFYLDDDLLTFHRVRPRLRLSRPRHRRLSESCRAPPRRRHRLGHHRLDRSLRRPLQRPDRPPLPQRPPRVPARGSSPRDDRRPLRIGYAGSGYRREEFALIWDALQAISRRYGDRLCFEFWGLDVGQFPPLASPCARRPSPSVTSSTSPACTTRSSTSSSARSSITPPPGSASRSSSTWRPPWPAPWGVLRRPPYAALPHGLTCLKVANDPPQWQAALETLIEMPARDLDDLRRRCLQHVREEFSHAALIDRHEAAWRATEFHARTRPQRHPDGRPRVVYVLHSAAYGGGELQLWRRLRLARAYGIEPVVVIPRSGPTPQDAGRLAAELASENIELASAHYTCFAAPPDAAVVQPRTRNPGDPGPPREIPARPRPQCHLHSRRGAGLPDPQPPPRRLPVLRWRRGSAAPPRSRSPPPIAGSLQSDSLRFTARWADLLGTEGFCAREVAPPEFFRLGFERSVRRRPDQPWRAGPLRLVVTGTLQPRKRQAETIEAVGRLAQAGLDCRLDLYGYTHFFPDYLARCQQLIAHWGLQERVAVHGFASQTWRILADADAVLSLSTEESFPSALKEAMAAGLLVVATPIGGIPELILDGETGILCAGTDVDAIAQGIRRAAALDEAAYRRIVEAARRVARAEFHPNRAANDLLTMYLKALEPPPAPRPELAADLPAPEADSVPAPDADSIPAPDAGADSVPASDQVAPESSRRSGDLRSTTSPWSGRARTPYGRSTMA